MLSTGPTPSNFLCSRELKLGISASSVSSKCSFATEQSRETLFMTPEERLSLEASRGNGVCKKKFLL